MILVRINKVFLIFTHLFCGSIYRGSKPMFRSSDSNLLLLNPFPSSYYMTFQIAASNDENDLLLAIYFATFILGFFCLNLGVS